MPEVSVAIDGRSKKGSRTCNFRQDRNNFGGYVWRIQVTRMHFMVILIFVIVKVKRGSLVSCFFFLICNSEGEVFEESRIRKSADETFLAFSEIHFLKCTCDDAYNLSKYTKDKFLC